MNQHYQEIYDFWEKRAASDREGKLVTHRDKHQVFMEIDAIRHLLMPGDRLLDIGCGNGFSTSIYAEVCAAVKGIDYSEEMIQTARNVHQKANLSFDRQDVLDLHEKEGGWDVVSCTRCLINLTSWEQQQVALHEMSRILVPGGRLIFAEGIADGRDKLNELRVSAGLNPMPPVWHNLDFAETKLHEFLQPQFDLVQEVRFGVYDVLTRVVYPSSILPAEPQYGTPFHDLAKRLYYSMSSSALKEYSRMAIFVFVKKA
ncbi:MAG: class I SAM-dependent methyltransferase [Kiritimatiellia bacterium]